MAEGTIKVNDQNFQQEVISSEIPVLVDFWAEWCGPCRMIAPVIEEIALEFAGKIKVCKLNVEEGAQTSSTYGVMNIPTIMIFDKGERIDKIVGAVPKNDIVNKINSLI